MNKAPNPLSIIFLICSCALILLNTFQLFRTLGPQRPIGFSGIKFSGLSEVLNKETRIGYVSGQNIRETGPLAEYEQAQYMLAPVILDVERPAHKFVIINCSNDESALAILKKLNARPLLRNQFGVILATTELPASKTEAVRP